MGYLCIAVKKEVVTREKINNLEEALAYFQERYLKRVRDKMEGMEKSLEHKIQYLIRKLENENEDLDKQQKFKERKQELEETWSGVRKWLNGEDKQEAVYIEEGFEQYKTQLMISEEGRFFRMAGICRVCQCFIVIEEIHTYHCQRVENVKDSLEAFKKLPVNMTKDSYALYLSEEKEDTEQRYIRQISKIRAQVKREYHKDETLLKNAGILQGL